MRLATKIAYNTIVQILGKVVSTILGLLAIGVITRYLGPSGFGQYTTVVTFLSFFAVLADLGLTLVTAQMISSSQEDQQSKILSNLLSMRLFSIVVFLALAPAVVFFMPYEAVVKWGVLVALLSFFFPALNQIFVGLFQKELRMDKVSWAEIIGRGFLLISVFASVYLDLGLLGVLWATVLASLVNFLLLFIFSRKYARVKLEYNPSIWREIFKKSWPLAITITFNLIYLRADILILSLIKSQTEVGIYGAAYKVIDVLTTIPFMFAGIVLPVLTVAWVKPEKEGFFQALQRSFDLMAIIAVPLIIGAQFLSGPIMVLVAGEEFRVAGSVLQILIGASSLIFLSVMFSHAIVAFDAQKKMISAYVFVSVTALFGYLFFIPKYSYFGAAWVTIYSELAVMLAAVFWVWKISSFLPQLKVFSKALFASVSMGAFLYLFPDLSSTTGGLFLSLIIAMVVYFLVLVALQGITKRDIFDLLNKSYDA